MKYRESDKYQFEGKYFFDDRSEGGDKLLIIVAGYKSELWDVVFERIENFTPSDFDVCIVSPGLENEELSSIAEGNDWSYISTEENKLALAQNMAIKQHPEADYIFKLDEDIFIGKEYFQQLLSDYKEAKKNSRYKVGYFAPMLNVNGFSYTFFLDEIGERESYMDEFGEFVSTMGEISASKDSGAAEFI